MKPIEMAMNDVKLVLEARHTTAKFGLNPNDVVNALRRKLHDNSVDSTPGLKKLIGPILGQMGIWEVLHNLQLEFDPNDDPDNLMEKWLSYRGVDRPPQPHVLLKELGSELIQMAEEAATEKKETLDAPMKDRLTRLLRHTSLFYRIKLRKNDDGAPSGEGTRNIAEMLEKLTLSQLCKDLNYDDPVQAMPYDPISAQTIVLSGGAACAALPQLAELTGAAATWTAEQRREFSDCLLALLKAWGGDNPRTPKACTVADSRDTPTESLLTCYDEMGDKVILKGGPLLAYGTDVLIRAADEGDIWAPEPQVVPQADVWETPDTVSRKDTRSANMLRRDLAFISYSHADAGGGVAAGVIHGNVTMPNRTWQSPLAPSTTAPVPGRESSGRKAKLFISYSHRDERYREQLGTHLAGLRRQGLILDWHDRKIVPGKEWRDVIDQNLDASDCVLLLVSPDFLASDYCYGIEMQRTLEKHREGRVIAIPVIVRAADWRQTPLGDLQALPKDAKPVVEWTRRDRAWLDVIQGIRRALAPT